MINQDEDTVVGKQDPVQYEYDYSGLIAETIPKHFEAVLQESDADDDNIVWLPHAPDYYNYGALQEVHDVRGILDDYEGDDAILEYNDDTLLEYNEMDNDDIHVAMDSQTLKMKIEEIYETQQAFHIILLIGMTLISALSFLKIFRWVHTLTIIGDVMLLREKRKSGSAFILIFQESA